ncbi:hypothetical protein AHAS_Ahas12G0122300 [Arachis hypogaea]
MQSFPSQLEICPIWNYLMLDAYSIDGEIPLKIGNLTNLYTLSVYRNDLSGTIPTTIKDMLLELARREKNAGIKADVDLDIFMKSIAFGGQETDIVVEYIIKVFIKQIVK